VTVTLEVVADSRTVTVTLVVPAINLGQETENQVTTAAIETTHHITIGGPSLITGPWQTYRVLELHGTAQSVQS
jgi:hypothetical protein